MKNLIRIFIALIACNYSYAQDCKKPYFEDPIQVDSSNIFIIPVGSCSNITSIYGNENYLPHTNDYANVVFYNSKENKSFYLLKDNLGKIQLGENKYMNIYSMKEYSTKKNLFFMIKMVDYNKDGVIDSDDPFYLYATDKNGNNLTQITPDNCAVISYHIYQDQNIILVKMLIDSNNDHLFTNKDNAIYYKIDLDNLKGEKILELK